MPAESEKALLPADLSRNVNFLSLTSPASISSSKSSSSNIQNESLFMPNQKLLSLITNNTAETNLISKQNYHEQGLSHTQHTTEDSFANSLPHNLPRLLTVANRHYCIFPAGLTPTDILPTTCSSLSEGITTAPPVLTNTSMKEQQKREKSVRKSKAVQSSPLQTPKNGRYRTVRSLTTATCTINESKHKNARRNDIRIRRQWRRLKLQRQLVFMKFMKQKQKQRKKQRISWSKLPDSKTEQLVPKLINSQITGSERTLERRLSDIIATNLKISFDATQNIASICLYYHRRHKPDVTNERSSNSMPSSDNKLDLLIEAVEFIETMHGSSEQVLSSNQ